MTNYHNGPQRTTTDHNGPQLTYNSNKTSKKYQIFISVVIVHTVFGCALTY